jgi:hypothetical protein
MVTDFAYAAYATYIAAILVLWSVTRLSKRDRAAGPPT